MSTPVKNGCLNANRIYAQGTIVEVMPRDLAQISAARNEHSIGQTYTVADAARLKKGGYRAVVERIPTAPDGAYRLRSVVGGALCGSIYASCIFGPAHDIGDVVEVGSEDTPDDPPKRRIFAGYAFDYKFNPVVISYDEDDTAAILDNCNTAVVDLEDSELWDFVFPVEATLVALPPKYEVVVKKDGQRMFVVDMGRQEWCDIWDNTNG